MKSHLITQYKLKAIEEVDTPWQLEELIQVSDAFGKLAKRPQDVITLTGCTLIRIKESLDDDPDAKVGGTYKPGPHSLTLTNTAFVSDTERFFGTGITLCPYSHGIILHEVGHVIEFHDWQAQKKQSNEGIQDIEIQMEKCKQLIPHYAEQLKEIALACDQEMEQFLQESKTEQSKLLKALETAKQEFAAIRQRVWSAYGEAIDVCSNAHEEAPKGKSQAAIAFDTFLKQLYAMLKALQEIKFSNRDLALTDLTQALVVWKATQDAETTFRKTLTGIVPEYVYIAFRAMSLMGQVLDIAELYPQIMHEEQILRNNYRQRVAADEQKKDELTKQHKAAIATAAKTWADEQELYLTLMQKSLSTRIGAVKDAQRMYKERKSTPCLQKFIDFVTTHNIAPITVYAKQEWEQGNRSEFFAESYHLFLNDPEFLQAASLDLYTWFEGGEYM